MGSTAVLTALLLVYGTQIYFSEALVTDFNCEENGAHVDIDIGKYKDGAVLSFSGDGSVSDDAVTCSWALMASDRQQDYSVRIESFEFPIGEENCQDNYLQLSSSDDHQGTSYCGGSEFEQLSIEPGKTLKFESHSLQQSWRFVLKLKFSKVNKPSGHCIEVGDKTFNCTPVQREVNVEIGLQFSEEDFLTFGSDGKRAVESTWVFTAPRGSKGYYLLFESFNFPEDEEKEGGEDNKCKTNYLAVKLRENGGGDFTELAAHCGSGEVDSYDVKPGDSVKLEIRSQIGQPWDFSLQIKLGNWEAVRSLGGGESCYESDGSVKAGHFTCPENEQICLRNALKCDGLPDCPDGGDEIGCDYSKQHERDSGCGSRRYQEGVSGSFSSDRYPCAYERNHRCIWEIEAPANTSIVISFNDVFGIDDANGDASCQNDNLAIYSQPKLQSQSELLDRLCGHEMPAIVIAPTNKVLVMFESGKNSASSTKGFRLHWAAVSENDLSFFIGEDRAGPIIRKAKEIETVRTQLKAFSGVKACSKSQPGTITVLAGIVTSLNYQHGKSYPQKCKCSWQFDPKIESGYKFKHFEFHFNDFDVPARNNCDRAALKFMAKIGSTWKLRETYCNWKPVPKGKPLIMKAQTVLVDFDVNVKLAKAIGRGFSIEFKVVTEKDEPIFEKPVKKRTTPSPIEIDEKPEKPTKKQQRRTTTPSPDESFVADSPSTCGIGPVMKQRAKTRSNPAISRNVRIVGGTAAGVGFWRWHVHLINWKCGTHCGGTIISDRWILTAAHCFNKKQRYAGDWTVKIGHQTKFDDTAWNGSPVLKPKVQAIFLHKGYSPKEHNHDIALIKLQEKIDLPDLPTATFRSMCLPSMPPEAYRKKARRDCYVIGFGRTMETGNENALNQAAVPIIDTEECKAMNPDYKTKVNTEQMICAGYEAGGVDACQGDSGGSLSCEVTPGHWEIQGVVSFGKGCAGAKAPGVYTNVWHYKDWIASIIKEFEDKNITYQDVNN